MFHNFFRQHFKGGGKRKNTELSDIQSQLNAKISEALQQWSSNFGHYGRTSSSLSKYIPNYNAPVTETTKRNRPLPNVLQIQIELAGSGKVLSYAVPVNKEEKLSRLFQEAIKLLPLNAWYNYEKFKFFIGHGGREVSGDVLVKDVFSKKKFLLVMLPVLFEYIKLKNSAGFMNFVAVSPNGTKIARGFPTKTIRIWHTENGDFDHEYLGHHTSDWHNSVVSCVKFSPDNNMLASSSYDRTVKLWNIQDGSLIQTLPHTNMVTALAFSSNGKLLASASLDSNVKFWDTKNGKLIRTLPLKSSVNSMDFSPNGALLALGCGDKTIKIVENVHKLLNKDEDILIRTLESHTDAVFAVRFNSNGRVLASGGQDTTIKLWNVSTLKVMRTLEGHTESVNSVSFSFDNNVLVSGSNDNTLKLWNLATYTAKTIALNVPIESVAYTRVYLSVGTSEGVFLYLIKNNNIPYFPK